MAQRRKKNKENGEGREAAGRKPRPRKGRSKAPEARDRRDDAAPQAPGGPDEPRVAGRTENASTPPTESSASRGCESQQAPAAPLPGVLYQRASRWWWRVQLPGENKAKARPLKAPGAKAATDDRQTAERIAFEMWQHALQENAARQVKLESTEKIERLKAQFLDKVRHFSELVETANARIETEERARAEAEAKLAQMAQANGLDAAEAQQQAQETALPAEQIPAPTEGVGRPEPPQAPAQEAIPTADQVPASDDTTAEAGKPQDETQGAVPPGEAIPATADAVAETEESQAEAQNTIPPSPAETPLPSADQTPESEPPGTLPASTEPVTLTGDTGLIMPAIEEDSTPGAARADHAASPSVPASAEPATPAGNTAPARPEIQGEPTAGSAAPSHSAAPDVPPALPARTEPPRVETPPPEVPTGACECCGATGIAQTHLTAIDSGQLLCPRCLAAFRADLARLTGRNG